MRLLRALAAATVLAALVVGVPLLLAHTIGNPLHGWADLKAGDINDWVIIDVLAAITYLAWAQFAASVVIEALAAVRRTPIPAAIPFVFSGQQQLARTLVGAALLLATATATVVTPTGSFVTSSFATTAPAQPVTTSAPLHATHAGATHDDTAGARAETTATPTRSYVVPHDGDGPDTYWDIATATLGSGERWHEIWALNEGRHQDDGSVMTRAELLRPGWTVLIPDTVDGTSSVTVVPGDNLTAIAHAHGSTEPVLWSANGGRAEPGGRVFDDPNLILPGWTISIPTAPAQTTPAKTAPTQNPTPAAPAPTTTGHTTPAQTTTGNGHGPHRRGPVGVPSGNPYRAPRPAKRPILKVSPKPTPPASAATAPPARPADATAPRSFAMAPMIVFTGGGLLLAGVTLAALRRYRRRNARWRTPGQSVAATPHGLVPVEKALTLAGTAATADVLWLDHALRALAQAVARDGGQMPDVLAAHLSDDSLELVLIKPLQTAPAPWRVDATHTRWTISRDDDLHYDALQTAYQFAPYPTLASVGYTSDGDTWLLDLERVGALSVTGPSERCLNLARFVAAELANNTWSEQLQVTLVGFGKELADLNPTRLTYTEDAAAALATLHRQFADLGAAADQLDVDPLAGRVANIAGDIWVPHVVLIAPGVSTDSADLDALLTAMRQRRQRNPIALVIAGDHHHASPTRWHLAITENATVHLPELGIDLVAQQLPADEASDLAALVALAARAHDQPQPANTDEHPPDEQANRSHDDQPRGDARGVVDEAYPPHPTAEPTGALAPTVTTGDQSDSGRRVITPLSVAALTPHGRRRDRSDLDLDDDLADWTNPDTTRAKVRLLGAPLVTASGALPADRPRTDFHTEVVAFLATRPGATVTQLATALWPEDRDAATKTAPRQAVVAVRKWLGVDPRTGDHHLPFGGTGSVVGEYHLDGVLLDAQLVRRLHTRASARGLPNGGVADLIAALELVDGIPLDRSRVRPRRGTDGRPVEAYAWLIDDPLDREYIAMVADIAHLVATHCISVGRFEQAAWAARIALRAGDTADTPLLDLVAACDAAGNIAEADEWIRRIMDNHDAEVEEDLPPSTFAALTRRTRR